MLRRALRMPVQGLLAPVWSDEAASKPVSCDNALAVLTRVAALPAAQRELAERVQFQPG